jgi:cell division protein FtsI (penicillin-binding protein 3)
LKKPRSILSPWAVCGLSLVLVLGFSVLAVEFYRLQILEHALWAKKAAMQQQIRIDMGAKRGSIFGSMPQGGSFQDVTLVSDSPCFHLYVDSLSLQEPYKKMTAVWLSKLIDKNVDEILEEFSKKSRFRKLLWHLDIEQKERIEKEFRKFIKNKPIPKNALFFLSGYQRVYPLGSIAGSLLHTLGTQEGLRGPERIATGGLEKRLDLFLKGSSGQLVSYRTPKGRLDGTKLVKKPQNGSDVFLTLHPLIQTLVEKQIEVAVKQAHAKGGWAIVMEPHSGKIYALAQYPTLDLLDPQKFYQDPKLATYSNLKMLTDPFEPGSIMKPFTMLTCLKANRVLQKNGKSPVFFPQEKTACLDGRFPGRKNPIKDVHAYSFLNMDMALQKSSNIYMAKAISKIQAALGDQFYADQLKNTFGFGQKTALSMGPESAGFVPTPHKKTVKGRLEWSMPTPYSLSMGYNLLATTLQMTKAFAIIANGGKSVEPYLLEKIVKRNDQAPDEILFDHSTQHKEPLVLIHPEDINKIKYAMQFAVNRGGTAYRAKIPGYSACGKTATTEKLEGGLYSKEKHISTFAGFAPKNDPKFVCLIVIDEPKKFYIEGVGKNQYGGVCAAPSFSVIGQKTLEILGIEMDDPLSLLDPKESISYNEVKKLEDLFKQWNH